MNKPLLWQSESLLQMENLVREKKKFDTIITDPPYGVNFKSHYDDSYNYVFSNVDEWYENFFYLLNDKSHMFVFVPIKQIHKWIEAGIRAGFNFKNIISTKAHFIGGTFKPKNGFSYEFQPILHFTKGVGKPFEKYDFIKTSDSWFKDKRNANPQRYTYIYPNFIDKDLAFANTKSTVKNSKNTERHPNEKNVELLKYLVGISTKPGEVVFDPFMGGGSTGVAATSLGREFAGIELNEKYFDIASKKIKENNE